MQFQISFAFRFSRRFLKINKSGCDLIGFSEENISTSFDEFVHPDDKEIFNDQYHGFRKEKSTFKFENRYVTSDGDNLWLSWYCNSTLKEGPNLCNGKEYNRRKKIKRIES
jgi:PAS domain S-box-containing protein